MNYISKHVNCKKAKLGEEFLGLSKNRKAFMSWNEPVSVIGNFWSGEKGSCRR